MQMAQTDAERRTRQVATSEEARKRRQEARRKIPPQTMTVAQAAARLGISEERAYKAVAAKQIPTNMIGERRVVPIPAFERMLAEAVQPDLDGDDEKET
jgi:excisionase family DNA binding protein